MNISSKIQQIQHILETQVDPESDDYQLIFQVIGLIRSGVSFESVKSQIFSLEDSQVKGSLFQCLFTNLYQSQPCIARKQASPPTVIIPILQPASPVQKKVENELNLSLLLDLMIRSMSRDPNFMIETILKKVDSLTSHRYDLAAALQDLMYDKIEMQRNIGVATALLHKQLYQSQLVLRREQLQKLLLQFSIRASELNDGAHELEKTQSVLSRSVSRPKFAKLSRQDSLLRNIVVPDAPDFDDISNLFASDEELEADAEKLKMIRNHGQQLTTSREFMRQKHAKILAAITKNYRLTKSLGQRDKQLLSKSHFLSGQKQKLVQKRRNLCSNADYLQRQFAFYDEQLHVLCSYEEQMLTPAQNANHEDFISVEQVQNFRSQQEAQDSVRSDSSQGAQLSLNDLDIQRQLDEKRQHQLVLLKMHDALIATKLQQSVQASNIESLTIQLASKLRYLEQTKSTAASLQTETMVLSQFVSCCVELNCKYLTMQSLLKSYAELQQQKQELESASLERNPRLESLKTINANLTDKSDKLQDRLFEIKMEQQELAIVIRNLQDNIDDIPRSSKNTSFTQTPKNLSKHNFDNQSEESSEELVLENGRFQSMSRPRKTSEFVSVLAPKVSLSQPKRPNILHTFGNNHIPPISQLKSTKSFDDDNDELSDNFVQRTESNE